MTLEKFYKIVEKLGMVEGEVIMPHCKGDCCNSTDIVMPENLVDIMSFVFDLTINNDGATIRNLLTVLISEMTEEYLCQKRN